LAEDTEYMMRAKTTGSTGGSTNIVCITGGAVTVIVLGGRYLCGAGATCV
jgi:hypothetical protein